MKQIYPMLWLIPNELIQDSIFIKKINSVLKKNNIKANSIRFYDSGRELSGLFQIIILKDISRVGNPILIISKNLVNVDENTLGAHFCLALANSNFLSKKEHILLYIAPALILFIGMLKLGEHHFLVSLIPFFTSIFITERIKQIYTYFTAINSYGCSEDSVLELGDSFLKKNNNIYILRLILSWAKFLNKDQWKTVIDLLKNKNTYNRLIFTYFFGNPIIIIYLIYLLGQSLRLIL